MALFFISLDYASPEELGMRLTSLKLPKLKSQEA
jgi:hypothetical protein